MRGWVTPNAGRIELLHNGTWGTVCSGGWSYPDAQVACRSVVIIKNRIVTNII